MPWVRVSGRLFKWLIHNKYLKEKIKNLMHAPRLIKNQIVHKSFPQSHICKINTYKLYIKLSQIFNKDNCS